MSSTCLDLIRLGALLLSCIGLTARIGYSCNIHSNPILTQSLTRLSRQGQISANDGSKTSDSLSESHFDLQSIYTKDNLNVWLLGDEESGADVGQAVVLYSDDAGKSWQRQFSVRDATFFNIKFVNSQIGWIVGVTSEGNGIVLKSTDAGKSWVRLALQFKEMLVSSQFINNDYGWVVGNQGHLFQTQDGGESWRTSLIKETSGIHAIGFGDKSKGWAIGEDGQVYQTFDGGINWQSYSENLIRLIPDIQPTEVDFKEVNFFDSQNGFIAAQYLVNTNSTTNGKSETTFDYWGVVFKTRDGGRVWEPQIVTKSLGLKSAQFISPSELWVVSTWGYSPKILFHSIDGGKTWIRVNGPIEDTIPSTVLFSDAKCGWLIAENGRFFDQLFRTVDGGKNWIEIKFLRVS